MKTFPALYLVFFLLLLSSCRSSYQYVSPLPNLPEFTESGEKQGSLAVGTNHYEIQGSASFLKNFGVGFNAFNAPNSAVRSYTLHYFRQGKRWSNLYTSAFVGYDKGNLKNDNSAFLVWGDSYKEKSSSSYETFRAGGGFYFSSPEKRIQYGCFVNFQQIQFYKLDLDFIPKYSIPYYSYSLKETQNYFIASPTFSMTLFSKNRLFFMRNHLVLELPLSDPLVTAYKSDYYRHIHTSTLRPSTNLFSISIAVGMRIAPSMFKNINWK